MVQTARKWGYDWALEIRSFLFFISQYSLQSQNTFFYVYIIFVFYIIVFTLQKVNSIHILGGVLWQLFKSFVFVYIFKAFFLKLVHEFELLKQTFWLDVRRNILLYYLQVGGIVQKISSKPGLISMRLCCLNYSTRALDCKYASTQATFVMVLHFFVFASFHGYSSMIEYLHTKFK